MEPDLSANPVDLAAQVDQGVAQVDTCITIGELAVRADAQEGIKLDSLEFGTVILVRTRFSQYRLTVLNGPSGDVFIEGGNMLHGMTAARIDGATAGGSALKLGWIGVGLQIELTVGGVRFTTSPVRSIEIETNRLGASFEGRPQ